MLPSFRRTKILNEFSIANIIPILDTHVFAIKILYNAVKNVLVLFGEFLEVPFIWTYKKDLIASDPETIIFSRADLWHIFDLEHNFRKFIKVRNEIQNNNPQNSYIDRLLLEASELDELHDLNMYIKFQGTKTSSMKEIVELRRKGVIANIKYLEYVHKGLHKSSW